MLSGLATTKGNCASAAARNTGPKTRQFSASCSKSETTSASVPLKQTWTPLARTKSASSIASTKFKPMAWSSSGDQVPRAAWSLWEMKTQCGRRSTLAPTRPSRCRSARSPLVTMPSKRSGSRPTFRRRKLAWAAWHGELETMTKGFPCRLSSVKHVRTPGNNSWPSWSTPYWSNMNPSYTSDNSATRVAIAAIAVFCASAAFRPATRAHRRFERGLGTGWSCCPGRGNAFWARRLPTLPVVAAKATAG
mmetsp:Transcript_39284/g.108310  ORF Transcript_39284/g.108310 Transcript_39284/m.108310 type:complete len:249 (+) Transcript_39284:368-1114(+)